MKLWTIQPAEIYNQIINEGHYRFDDKISEKYSMEKRMP